MSSMGKERTGSGTSSNGSKWFRRARGRGSSGKQEGTAGNPFQLDMNFSDIGEFVDMTKVRRPSATSSLSTAESAFRVPPVAGGNRDEGERRGSFQTDSGSLLMQQHRRKSSKGSRSVLSKRSLVGSPHVRQASMSDSRSMASSLKGDGSQQWSESGTVRQSSDAQQSSRGRRLSVVSAFSPAQFTDPWAADREQQLALMRKSQSNATTGDTQSASEEAPVQLGTALEPGTETTAEPRIPGIEYPPRKSEPWAPPESWAVLPTSLDGAEESSLFNNQHDAESEGDGNSSDSDLENDINMYSLRIYREDSTFGTFHCRLSTTTAEFMQMAAKKFFIPDITRHCLYMQKANGLDRTLKANERPADILKRYLEQMGYRPEDNITLQGREDNSYLCKFSLLKAAIPRVSPNMEVEVSSFHYVDLRARKLQTVPVFLYAHANKI
ncbi:cysteinyl-tRNA synthetase, partial [Linderina pennispora]